MDATCNVHKRKNKLFRIKIFSVFLYKIGQSVATGNLEIARLVDFADDALDMNVTDRFAEK